MIRAVGFDMDGVLVAAVIDDRFGFERSLADL